MVGSIGDELEEFFKLLRKYDIEEYQDDRLRVKLAPIVPAPIFQQMPMLKEERKVSDEEILMDPYAGLNI